MAWRTFADILSSQATIITESSGDQVYCIPFSWLDENFSYLKDRIYIGDGAPSGTPSQDKAWYVDKTNKRVYYWNSESSEWVEVQPSQAVNADKVDNFHASLLQSPYSKITVGTSAPASPSHGELFWNNNDNKLFKYDTISGSWLEIDWENIVKASPDWINGLLQIDATTGKLQISNDGGTNWYDCIPAVGSSAIELATVDNTSFTYKYYILPGATVIIRNANHFPIIMPKPSIFDIRIDLQTDTASNNLLLYINDTATTTYSSGIYRTDVDFSSATESLNGHKLGWIEFSIRRVFSQFSLNFYTDNYVQSVAIFKYYENTYGITCLSNYSVVASSSYWLGTLRANISGYPLRSFYIATITRKA